LHRFSIINTCFSSTTGWIGLVRSASGVETGGFVFGMSTTVVTPPATALSVPEEKSSFSVIPPPDVHAERRDRLFDEMLRCIHADSRPVREIPLVVRAQSPVRRPAEIKQHDVAAADRSVFGFPLGDETSRYIIALVEATAIEVHAPPDQAPERDLLDRDVGLRFRVADEVRGRVDVSAVVLVEHQLIGQRPVSVPVRTPQVVVKLGMRRVVGHVLFERLAQVNHAELPQRLSQVVS